MNNHILAIESIGDDECPDCISSFAFHNLDLLLGKAVEVIDHPVDLSFVFFDLGLLGKVLKIIGVFGDGENLSCLQNL